ncbi:MAG: amylosucrase [Chloroflexi bacterium]|nr:amylosucrase [Chloroflexota bacterium]
MTPQDDWFAREAYLTLRRLLPRLSPLLPPGEEGARFLGRLEQHFATVFRCLYLLYNNHYDFFYHLEMILTAAARLYAARPAALKALDQQREANPLWFQSQSMMGGVCYVDLFAGNLQGIRAKIPYFQELGLTYLHLMPLFKSPAGENDGGYAVSSYRDVEPKLGTMAELAGLADELRAHGISLVLDFVFNHTSDEHEWAKRALAGEEEYQNYYYMFDDRTLPDQYERTLREIFPEQSPGSFTYRDDLQKWVWTTFRSFQWDLNYRNPQVFNAMLQEMLFLANQGVEFLRLDAVAFIWKEVGTPCESLPQVHDIIQAFNALTRIAAPAMLFKSEAIVHPDQVNSYVNPQECALSYNPTMMALMWEALATREVKLLYHSMRQHFALLPECAWVNYVRSHDDIGWTFADEVAAGLGINGFDHRQFLNQFYTGRFKGSFATGQPFNYNPVTRDMRISGTCASLAGLEQALETGDALLIDHAVSRIVLIYSIALSAGGVPLIYLGDEIATCNDYSYEHNPAQANDSRWVHRPPFDWARAERRRDASTIEGRVFQTLARLIQVRKSTPALANGRTTFFDTGSEQVLGYVRNGALLALCNFSEREQRVSREALRAAWPIPAQIVDLVSGQKVSFGFALTLQPYQVVWLKAAS